eukprot:CAMPEP_0201893860 /NCGR_PEP_ID=MMETSP0902-20130614/39541_1 /ASSEMBLY_ACC=CAM_ASM_000551 /TAXON_ID=420261 /ORGANISM="Thalassiosira antarctica, Strain CCMP982" /LENGTH=30 /DNA_ID= /DNA_START= /DNA_END= /DNA_ORIENTATION=
MDTGWVMIRVSFMSEADFTALMPVSAYVVD